MSEIKDLTYDESINKIQEFVRHNATCLFCTRLRTDAPFMTRPMAVELADNEGNLWFLSDALSDKNYQIARDDYVQLLFTGDGHSRSLSLFGRAEISYDKETIDQLWEPIAKAWFQKGKDDPSICVIKVVPHE